VTVQSPAKKMNGGKESFKKGRLVLLTIIGEEVGRGYESWTDGSLTRKEGIRKLKGIFYHRATEEKGKKKTGSKAQT